MTSEDPYPVEIWQRLLISLRYPNPYEFVRPEERATFPLTVPMVEQNYALLCTITDQINVNVVDYGRRPA